MNRTFASRLLAFVAALVMLMSLCSFSLAETTEVKEVTLTLASYRSLQESPVLWWETETMQNILKAVEEKHGYRVSFDTTIYDADKMNLLFISGDLPDIVYFAKKEQANIVLENEMALNLKPLLEEYAPNMLLDMYAQRNELISELAGGEEKGLYFVPNSFGTEYYNGGTALPRGYTVRWDYYKEIGAPAIESDDDYIAALAAMVAAHPTTPDGKPVYAYGTYQTFSEWYFRAAMTKPALVNPWTFTGYLYMDGLDDNVLYNGYTNTERSAFWQDMVFMNKLYRMGLFDVDSFTQTADEHTAKIQAGQYVGTPTPSNDLYNTLVKEDPNTTASMVAIPSSNQLVFANKLHLAGYYPDQQYFISADSENWEAALAVFDIFHDPMMQRIQYSGVEGVNWNYVDGVPTLTEETVRIKNNSDENKYFGLDVRSPLRVNQPAVLCPDGYPINLFDTESMRSGAMNNAQKDMAEFYGVSYPAEACYNLVKEGKTIDYSLSNSQTVSIAREEMPNDIARILTKCNDICYSAIAKLVMAETDEEFKAVQDQVMADLAAVNEAKAWEWCQQAQAEARKIIDPVYSEFVANWRANNQ